MSDEQDEREELPTLVDLPTLEWPSWLPFDRFRWPW